MPLFWLDIGALSYCSTFSKRDRPNFEPI